MEQLPILLDASDEEEESCQTGELDNTSVPSDSDGDGECDHVDLVDDFSTESWQSLVDAAKRHDLLLFEDRKFADIGNTVFHQMNNSIYCMSEWVDIINAIILRLDIFRIDRNKCP